mgnify:FL=1
MAARAVIAVSIVLEAPSSSDLTDSTQVMSYGSDPVMPDVPHQSMAPHWEVENSFP